MKQDIEDRFKAIESDEALNALKGSIQSVVAAHREKHQAEAVEVGLRTIRAVVAAMDDGTRKEIIRRFCDVVGKAHSHGRSEGMQMMSGIPSGLHAQERVTQMEDIKKLLCGDGK